MLAAASALLVAVAAPIAIGPPAHAAEGVCAEDTGTTVVVDFTDLGGDIEVGCAEDSDGMTGMQALEAAGFSVEAVSSGGLTGACRIDDQPAADQALEVGGKDYTEACQKFPPVTAYWGYYVAPAAGEWAYAQKGADVNTVVVGGFEGWRFQLDQSAESAPMPDFDPANPPAASADDGSADDSAGDAAEDEGISTAVWIGVGIAILLILATVFTLARRRRSEDA